jgi:SAM-dependent methyltransferase
MRELWGFIPVRYRLELQFLLERNGYLRRRLFPEVEVIKSELRLMDGPWSGHKSAIATRGMSERVVEIPWVLSRIKDCRRVLDVGTAWANPVYVDALARMGPDCEIIGADISSSRRRGVRIVKADVRNLPWPEDYFDVVSCVSTLEHIGMDNADYGSQSLPASPRTEMTRALNEMARVLRPDGSLIVTVPLGKAEDYGSFYQHDLAQWQDLVRTSSLRSKELAIYEHSELGWVPVDADAAPQGRYGGPDTRFATGLLCTVLTK